MSDIVERLRNGDPCAEDGNNRCKVMNAASGCACAEAADTITALRADVERLTLGRETMGNLWAREKENSASLRAENEKLRAALKTARPFIGWAVYYPTLLDEIDAALEGK